MKIFVLLYCLVQGTCSAVPDCRLMGAYTSLEAAQGFADTFCMDDKECSTRMSIEPVDLLGNPNQ